MIRSVQPEGGATDLGRLFTSLFWARKSRGRSANNLRLYRNALGNFEKYLGRPATTDDLDDDTVAAWLPWFLERGRSEETANKNLRHLLALWRFLARKRIVEEFPAVDQLAVKERVPKCWLKSELEKLFDSAAKERGSIGGVAAGFWWKVLLLVVWFTGERIGAVLELYWDDYDMESGWVVARAEVRKGKKRDKAFPLPPSVCKQLEALRVKGERRIFRWERRSTSIYYHLNRILARAGLPTDRMSKFHRVRKSMASYLKAAGGDPTEALDHSSSKVTKKYYLDPRVCSPKSAADLLFDPTK